MGEWDVRGEEREKYLLKLSICEDVLRWLIIPVLMLLICDMEWTKTEALPIFFIFLKGSTLFSDADFSKAF